MVTPELSYTLGEVRVNQGNSFEPYLRVYLTVKLENNRNNTGVNSMELFSIRGTLFVNTSNRDSGWREIGFAETLPTFSSVYLGDETRFDLVTWLSHHLMTKIENMRVGGDLYFRFVGGSVYAQANVIRGTERSNSEVIILKSYNPTFKYPRSDWIEDLNKTEFDKIELVELPKVDLPQLPITSDITKFLHEAERALKEGRWGDVFGENRKALNALYNGIEEWGAKEQLTEGENDSINNAKPDERTGTRRNIYFTRLVGHSEKGKRLNTLRNSLFQYLSLDPHEPKGMDFTQSDAIFVSRATINLISNVLSYLAYQIAKDRR